MTHLVHLAAKTFARYPMQQLMDNDHQVVKNIKNNEVSQTEMNTIETPGTVYNLLTSIRNILLESYRGNEEALQEWGFDVIVGTAKSPVRKKE